MHKDLTEELSIEDYKMDLENRIRNLLWTVSGDYTLDVKPDVSLFLRSKEIALYDGSNRVLLPDILTKIFLVFIL